MITCVAAAHFWGGPKISAELRGGRRAGSSGCGNHDHLSIDLLGQLDDHGRELRLVLCAQRIGGRAQGGPRVQHHQGDAFAPARIDNPGDVRAVQQVEVRLEHEPHGAAHGRLRPCRQDVPLALLHAAAAVLARDVENLRVLENAKCSATLARRAPIANTT